jgi:hypothetical protein
MNLTRFVFVRGVWFRVARHTFTDMVKGTGSVVDFRPATIPVLALTFEQWHRKYAGEVQQRMEWEQSGR